MKSLASGRMRALLAGIATIVSVHLSIAQTTQDAQSADAKSVPYIVQDRALNHRLMSRVVQSPGADGVIKTNSYTEIATGLHYVENGQLVESRPEIVLLPDGSAAATKGDNDLNGLVSGLTTRDAANTIVAVAQHGFQFVIRVYLLLLQHETCHHQKTCFHAPM
jgi:hypothetical protein